MVTEADSRGLLAAREIPFVQCCVALKMATQTVLSGNPEAFPKAWPPEDIGRAGSIGHGVEEHGPYGQDQDL